MDQLVDDLGVDELERTVAPVDHRDLDAERGEHRCVLDADHPCADHGEGAGKPAQGADFVTRDHALAIRLNALRRHGLRTGGDENVGSRDLAPGLSVRARNAQSMRIGERRIAAQDVDAVARQLIRDDRSLARDHLVDARQQLRRRSAAAANDWPRCRWPPVVTGRELLRERSCSESCPLRGRSHQRRASARRSRRVARALRPALRRADRPGHFQCKPGRSRRIRSRRHPSRGLGPTSSRWYKTGS